MQRYLAPVFAAILVAAAGAAESAAQPSAYALDVSVLTGPQGGALTIDVDATEGSAGVQSFEHVHVSLRSTLAQEKVVNRNDVPAPNGRATIELGPLERGAAVAVIVQVRGEPSPRTIVLRDEASARLRPDLVVAAVHAPPQTLTTRPVDVVADVAELNGDTGAQATLTLMLGPTPLAESKTVTVAGGGTKSVTFEGVKLEAPMSAELTVAVKGAEPYETDATNNSRTRRIEVTEHELVRANVLVPSLGGYGAQFNQHVYAPISNVPPDSLAGMEAVAKELEPQLVRIFYNDNWEERLPTAPANLESFYKTVKLAHESGATINVTYHTLAFARSTPVPSMTRFAGVLQELLNRGYNVHWVTVGNEPNGGTGTFPLSIYRDLHRALHDQLVARGIRDEIGIMAGDLVEAPSVGPLAGIPNHREWFDYMVEHMNDIVDAWSVHIYWRFHDESRMEIRLKDVYSIVNSELPPEARKPTYLMEFAVRGRDPYPAQPVPRYAFYDDGTEMRKTTLAGFQTLWFSIWAAQLGYAGAAKWDAYWGLYDNSSVNNQSYWLTDTPENGWAPLPTYHALRLLMQTTARGWQVVQVAPWNEDDWKVDVPEQKEKEISAYSNGDGSLTLFGLDTHGSQLNATSPESPSYSIGGLPPLTAFNLALWNAAGNGENSVAGTVTTDAAGVARFQVPLHAAFALTTVPVS